ncbi:hypothetical protein FACS189474_3890 [Bacteroidia bacterium]|nr:hypothetical protein FACS189474_3890 [Bacteroidia bacterium]
MKRKLFTFAILANFLLSGSMISAQGIYEDDLTASSTDDEDDYDAPLRGKDPGDGPGTGDVPIGEGLLILSALAGGYALVKKRSSKKESNL